jgi:O-methyltransferase involved in polyketide biosynthesis
MNGSRKELALAMFRKLLRTSSLVFKGDERAIDEARKEIKARFVKHTLWQEMDQEQFSKAMKDARECEQFLRENVLQGKRNERGNYEAVMRESDCDSEHWEVPKEKK